VLHRVCFEHEVLLGIILGFGKDNAALFERKSQIENFLSCASESYMKNPWNMPLSKPDSTSLEEELNAIEAKEGGIIDLEDEALINWTLHLPIGFLVDTTKTDLKQLRAKYKRERIKATRAYDKGDFLETTLRELSIN
jgi:hypothetical protein